MVFNNRIAFPGLNLRTLDRRELGKKDNSQKYKLLLIDSEVMFFL